VEQALFFLAPDVKARAGLLWDSSPVVDGRLQADQPWSDRAGLALGMGWKVFGVTLDAAWVGDVTVPRRGEDRSTYASSTHMLVFTVGYRHVR
jgi:long-subunit fatty acid transport protein